TRQLRRLAGLIGDDASNTEAAYQLIESAVVAEILAAAAEGQLIGAVGVEDMAHVKERRPIASVQVAQAEGVECAGPLVVGGDTEAMAKGVICVVLQSVPVALPQIHLEAVVGGIARRCEFA